MTDDDYDYERIAELWRASGGESGTRLENFTGGYKSGAESLREENERLRDDAQKIYADYMDRAAAMRDTGKMVRSLYAPKNERLNKDNGKLMSKLKASDALANALHAEILEYAGPEDTVAIYQAAGRRMRQS